MYLKQLSQRLRTELVRLERKAVDSAANRHVTFCFSADRGTARGPVHQRPKINRFYRSSVHQLDSFSKPLRFLLTSELSCLQLEVT